MVIPSSPSSAGGYCGFISRIALTITSSDYPRILPHRNRMGLFDEPTVARNRVLHGPAAPSRLILPIVDL